VRAIKYRELKQLYDKLGPAECVKHLSEALREGHLKPEDFSIREVAEVTLGDSRVRQLDPRHGGAGLLEAGEGVDVTAFSNITGQVVQSKIMEAYTQEAFVVSKLVDTIPTRLDGEKIPGIGRVKDEIAEVHPGMPYPSLGFAEDYIETPQTTKRGFIVPVTKEAVFFDRTHLVLQRAAEVGEILGLNKEKRLIDLLIGVTNNYKWKDADYNTYSSTGTGVAPDGDWINQFSEELVDWTDVDAAEQLFAEITYTAAGSETATTAANPLGNYTVVESRLAYRRIVASGEAAADARKWWFIGDFKKAFGYMENWPITVTQSPPNSEAEFNQDIVVRFKASERGAAAVINPRYVVKSTGAGSGSGE